MGVYKVSSFLSVPFALQTADFLIKWGIVPTCLKIEWNLKRERERRNDNSEGIYSTKLCKNKDTISADKWAKM